MDGWGFLDEAFDDYAEILGEAGRAAYWQALQTAWEALPALRPGEEPRSGQAVRATIEQMMEARVKATGELDALIRCKVKNLASEGRYLELARLCRENGRGEEARRWVEEGLAAFPAAKAWPLEDFAIGLYIERGDFGRAESLAWARFERRLAAEAYVQLMSVADAIGRREALREQAFARLWVQVAEEEARVRRASAASAWRTPARDQLLRIHLHENDAALVWRVFQGGRVSVGLWRAVAEVRARSHPEEAIALYRRLLPDAVEAGSRGASYEEALEVVLAIRQLRVSHGQQQQFVVELDDIRREGKAKRNFMKGLAGW